eukprot:TRINITY_DN1901_c0_g2_i1.p1 TRINITY_DN1901_c0_g2~~TRINITY_DN1901_c0_g2_i1.p1  ORF type:complete len:452 (+),score=101.84 TRINITY_DN1901_c0_g2_i1:225-1580(+)
MNAFSIQVIEAKELAPMDKSGTSDPYCRLSSSFNKQSFKTRVIDRTLHPHWGETFSFFSPSPEGQILIKVWDKDRWTKDDFLGQVVIDLSKYADGNPKVDWFPLENEPKKKNPERALIHLRLQFERSKDGSGPIQASAPSSASLPKVVVEEKPLRLEDVYDLGKELGRGGFSVVREAKHKKTGDLVAIKCIHKKTVKPEELVLLNREISIMTKLRHRNIVQLLDKFETANDLFLVLELVTGGELFDKIVERGFYSEDDAAKIVRQILEGVSYMHRHGVVHRDLKPENLLCSGKDGEVCKIADFGLSKDVESGNLVTSCGTPSYVAPEVLTGGAYDSECDIWSVGVITYVLLCGFTPFYGDTQRELFDKILRADFSFPSPEWDEISEPAKQFVKALLVANPNQRLNADKALEHAWLAQAAPLRRLVSLNSVRGNLLKLEKLEGRGATSTPAS